MLGLKLPTDPRWVNIVEKNIEEILSDHAFCEQKAASTAISLIIGYPEYTELSSSYDSCFSKKKNLVILKWSMIVL